MVAIQVSDLPLQGEPVGIGDAQISRAVQAIPDETGDSRGDSQQCRIAGGGVLGVSNILEYSIKYKNSFWSKYLTVDGIFPFTKN